MAFSLHKACCLMFTGEEDWYEVRAMLVVVMLFLPRAPDRPGSGPETPVPKDTAVVAKAAIPAHRLTPGEVRYIRHCAGCHGADARGGGAIGKVLEVHPRNLRSAELLRNSDDELVVRILHGKNLPVPVTRKRSFGRRGECHSYAPATTHARGDRRGECL
jgi:cytochrome c5